MSILSTLESNTTLINARRIKDKNIKINNQNIKGLLHLILLPLIKVIIARKVRNVTKIPNGNIEIKGNDCE
jgi:hypothetical protein